MRVSHQYSYGSLLQEHMEQMEQWKETNGTMDFSAYIPQMNLNLI